MKKLLNLLLAGLLIFSAGNALAASESYAKDVQGFHALGPLVSADTQGMTAFTDEQLENVVGGYTPNPLDPPTPRWGPFPWPWPGPGCWICGGKGGFLGEPTPEVSKGGHFGEPTPEVNKLTSWNSGFGSTIIAVQSQLSIGVNLMKGVGFHR